MKMLSVEANLSAIYTNHCLRATCITALDQAGFEARHIMTLSGQKTEASIRSYSRNVSDNMQRDSSLTLSTHMSATSVPEQATLSQTTTCLTDVDIEFNELIVTFNIPTTSNVEKRDTPVFYITNCVVTINNN